jgi:hypothetical protein
MALLFARLHWVTFLLAGLAVPLVLRTWTAWPKWIVASISVVCVFLIYFGSIFFWRWVAAMSGHPIPEKIED